MINKGFILIFILSGVCFFLYSLGMTVTPELISRIVFVSNKGILAFFSAGNLSTHASNTFILAIPSFIISVITAFFLSSRAASEKNIKIKRVYKAFFSLGRYVTYIPLILPALVLLYISYKTSSTVKSVLGVNFNIPLGGIHSVNYSDLNPLQKLQDLLRHLFLPCLTVLGFHLFMLLDYFYKVFKEQLKKPHVLACRARGYSDRNIFFRVVLPNCSEYLKDAIKVSLPLVLNSLIIVEIAFSWPGMGRAVYRTMLSDNPVLLLQCLAAWGWAAIGINLFIEILWKIPLNRYLKKCF